MTFTGLAAGEHTLRVVEVDAAGNQSAPKRYGWTVTSKATPPTGPLPAGKSCVSRRRFTLRLIRPPELRADFRGARIVAATLVDPAGKLIRKLKFTSRTTSADLRGLPHGTFRLTLLVRMKHKRIATFTRTYTTCTKSR